MFKYKTFEIERLDNDNIGLFQIQNKEVIEGGGRGRGPGTKTGRFEDKRVHIGFYSTFSGALNKAFEMDMENASDLKEVLNKIEEHKKYVYSLKLKED